jgi:hypothetical protein
LPLADKPIRFDCAGIRVSKHILRLPNGGTLIVKDHFGYSVNPDRYLVQTRLKNGLTLTTEDESRNKRVVCQEI